MIGDDWWGVGQASAIAVNGTQVLLTYMYTRGNSSGFYGQMCQVLDFSDIQNPATIQPERAIPEKGLTLADGSPRSGGFVNAAMIDDPFFLKQFWALREGKPMPHSATGADFCFVSDSYSVELAWIPEAALWGSVCLWP